VEPGVFEAETTAVVQGVYRFRVVASGLTMRGLPFTREQLCSGAVVPGGDHPFPRTGPSPRGADEALCELLRCLVSQEGLRQSIAGQHVDWGTLEKCVERWCQTRLAPPSEEDLREREGG